MRRGRSAPALAIAVLATAFVIGLGPTTNVASASTLTKARSMSPSSFIDALKRANDTRFFAVYRIDGYLFFQNGTIAMAQVPSPPGTKETTNKYGYTGSGRYAYLYHGPDGFIVQWIKIGTNVSACARPSDGGRSGALECSRPSPYLPSNGFAMEDAGFVPTYVLQSISAPGAVVSSEDSREFGSLRCLTEMTGSARSVACIDLSGYLVSWRSQNGSITTSRVTLTSLNRHPSASNFKTLVSPTKSLILPPV